MTLFEELGVEYKEVDGILYPLLSVDEAEYNFTDIGKYGRMWLRYMEENEPSEYRHMARTGQLRKQAEAVNEGAYQRLDDIEAAWLKKHMTGKKKTFMERTKIAESVYDMFRQGGTDDVRDKFIDVMYENQKLKEENTTLKELLEKAYEFMKQFVIDGVNLLERFLESMGKVIQKIR